MLVRQAHRTLYYKTKVYKLKEFGVQKIISNLGKAKKSTKNINRSLVRLRVERLLIFGESPLLDSLTVR